MSCTFKRKARVDGSNSCDEAVSHAMVLPSVLPDYRRAQAITSPTKPTSYRGYADHRVRCETQVPEA